MTCNDLVSWVVRNQKFDRRNDKFRKFPIPLTLFFDKSNMRWSYYRWSYLVWGNYCNEWSIYYLPFVFVTYWSNRNKDFSVFELVLSWFSNLINIMNKICWVKLYCPIKKPECKFSFCFLNRLFKPKKTSKSKNICSLMPNNGGILHYFSFFANLINLFRPLQLIDFLIQYQRPQLILHPNT